MTIRNCEACGTDCKGKKVWEKIGKRVICMTCGQRYTFDRNERVVERASLKAVVTE